MILIPAIDIKGGKVVRLFQGKFSQMTEYANDPVSIASKWKELGAQWLHLVDLDGAKDGVMANKETIITIAKTIKIPVEVGGGIRNEKTIDDLIKAGVARVILGTTAIENRKFLQDMIKAHGEKICVSLDCSNGFVAGRGWVSTSKIRAIDLAIELQDMNLKWMVYTDISKDGTLTGPDYDGIECLTDVVNISLIASGGIGTLEDVKKLAAMKGVAAAITGKAIYEGKLDFAEALKLC